MSRGKDDTGSEVNQDIKGFTVTDEDMMEMLEKYGHDITVVVYMGRVDGVPAFGVKGAGKDREHSRSGQQLANIFMEFLREQFENYAEKSKNVDNDGEAR